MSLVFQNLTGARDPPAAVRDVHARLCSMYPEYVIRHMPANVGGVDASSGAAYSCTPFVANAAVHGNCFQWHVDADPSSFGPGPWLGRYGDYVNGAPEKPLFVSLILYLDATWRREWDAETLFLDGTTDTGLLVSPRPRRAVLMHQDATHRVSAPSVLARRPRYSLVWKLVFERREKGAADQPETILRAEWGPPVRLPGAARPE